MVSLSRRLKACADLVREGKSLADVGCDHGYVPVYLAENDIIESAVASDINEKPLMSCRALVNEHALNGKIKCVLSDGLINVSKDDIDDILIAGMGGELIADILSKCPYVKEKHLILNPMTHPELARKWLYENGFEIENDIVVADSKHHYSVFDAYYTGNAQAPDDVKCFLGKIDDFSDREYFIHLLNYLSNKEKGGKDYSALITLIKEKIQ